jgi:hypothetical protein
LAFIEAGREPFPPLFAALAGALGEISGKLRGNSRGIAGRRALKLPVSAYVPAFEAKEGRKVAKGLGRLLLLPLLAGFLGAAGFEALSSAEAAKAQDPRLVATGELRLTDETGRTRLLLTLVRDKPRLFMLDSDGEYRLEMGLGESGEPHVWLRDADGAAKVQMALTGKGLPSFTLADQQGRDRAVLALSQSGEPTLILRDPKGKDRVALWRDAKGEGLALADDKGKALATLSVADGRSPALTFYKNGAPSKTLP